MPFSLELAILLNLFMMGLKTSSPFLRNKILNIKLSPGNTFPTTLEQQRQFGDMKKKQSFRLKSNANIASSSEGSSFQYQDWSSVVTFWREVIKNPHKLPIFIKGDGKYGTTDLQPIFQAGNRFEFQSVDMRYTKISTYALSFGYDGTKFFGYQSQRNSSARAVQDVLIEAIGHKCIAAGRTDKDVSAIGQIVSFSSSKPDYHKTVLAQLRAHQSVESGEVSIYDCVRVPRKLNARSSAIWRRYLYLVPLKRLRLSVEGNTGIDKSSEPQYNVNAEIVNKLLLALEGLELPYNAFAYQEDRNKGEGMRDLCTLHKARAYLVNLDLDSKNTYDNNSIAGESNVGLCIELVGDRFLRQMVRRLVSTAIHESRQFSTTMSKPTDTNQQIYNPLVDICHSGDRNKVQSPFPGEGLCLAGVGFDTVDLSFYRFMPKEQKNELLSEYGLSRSPYDRKTEND